MKTTTIMATLTTLTMTIMSMIMMNYNISLMLHLPMIHSASAPTYVGITLDWPSSLFAATVMLISTSIIMYSTAYVDKNKMNQFTAIMMLFVASMVTLIFSNNMFFIILGWDGLGLSSYLLVIFYQNWSSSASGAITILTNRIGDIAILVSIASLTAMKSWELTMSKSMPSLTMLMILTASMTKSAQYPFTAWLPAAMAAPTPISALVHSSTLVTAGVYLMMRMLNHVHPNTLQILLIVSLVTSLTASMSANWEMDMKKVIALSTLSQMALMMTSISLMLPMLCLFHLVTHALFKSTMFMCAGTMIHASSYQDSRSISMPSVSSPMLSSSLGATSAALMGLPFMAGFYSKDAIMESSLLMSKNSMTLTMLMLSVGLTATYNLRMTMMVSTEHPKPTDNLSPHENTMTITPFMMAFLSVVTGASLSWMMLPETQSTLSMSQKLLTPTAVISGILIGMNLQTKTSSIKSKIMATMWTMNYLSSTPPVSLTHSGLKMLKTDNSWHETSMPQLSWKMLKKNHQSMTSNNTMILIMLMSVPTTILLI